MSDARATITSIVIPSAFRAMAGAKPNNRRRVFELQARELMGHVHQGHADRIEVVDALQSMANESGLVDDIGQDEVQAIMAAADDALDVLPDTEAPPVAAGRDFRNGANGAGSKYETPRPLQWLDMSRWDIEPLPERKWAIKDRAPLNQAGLFSGEGGTGKSIIELMKNVAHVASKDWLGSLPEQGPAFYIGAEDDADEIHIRLAWIAKHYDVTFEELIKGGLKVMCLLGQDATLCAPTGKSGKVEVTALYRQLRQATSSRRTSASTPCPAPSLAAQSIASRYTVLPSTCRRSARSRAAPSPSSAIRASPVSTRGPASPARLPGMAPSAFDNTLKA
jgi:hypothetical protein